MSFPFHHGADNEYLKKTIKIIGNLAHKPGQINCKFYLKVFYKDDITYTQLTGFVSEVSMLFHESHGHVILVNYFGDNNLK